MYRYMNGNRHALKAKCHGGIGGGSSGSGGDNLKTSSQAKNENVRFSLHRCPHGTEGKHLDGCAPVTSASPRVTLVERLLFLLLVTVWERELLDTCRP